MSCWMEALLDHRLHPWEQLHFPFFDCEMVEWIAHQTACRERPIAEVAAPNS